MCTFICPHTLMVKATSVPMTFYLELVLFGVSVVVPEVSCVKAGVLAFIMKICDEMDSKVSKLTQEGLNYNSPLV